MEAGEIGHRGPVSLALFAPERQTIRHSAFKRISTTC
jgi:hypothetical protein